MQRWITASLCAILLWIFPATGQDVDVQALLDAARAGGMTPHAIYVRADLHMRGDAGATKRLAMRLATQLPHGESAVTYDAQGARLAIAAACAPDAMQAHACARSMQNVLGTAARVSFCVTGQTETDDLRGAALAMLSALGDAALEGLQDAYLVSLTGERAQAAICADGASYLGIPLIPMDY